MDEHVPQGLINCVVQGILGGRDFIWNSGCTIHISDAASFEFLCFVFAWKFVLRGYFGGKLLH